MSYNTIRLRAQNPIRYEALATGAVTPGQLLELLLTGHVQRHSGAAGKRETIFAMEDELQGKKITENYTTNTLVQYEVAQAGDEIYAILSDGENVVIGDYLESNGDGDLQKFTSGITVGVALEALDLSGSSGVDPSSRRIRIRVVHGN